MDKKSKYNFKLYELIGVRIGTRRIVRVWHKDRSKECRAYNKSFSTIRVRLLCDCGDVQDVWLSAIENRGDGRRNTMRRRALGP